MQPVGAYRQAEPPHRPGMWDGFEIRPTWYFPAHGLRAERAVVILSQTTTTKETTMFLNRFFRSAKSRPTIVPRPWPAVRLSVEALDDRIVPAKLFVGDAAIVEGNVGSQYALVNVSLDAPSNRIVTVNYATADGTANAGGD